MVIFPSYAFFIDKVLFIFFLLDAGQAFLQTYQRADPRRYVKALFSQPLSTVFKGLHLQQ